LGCDRTPTNESDLSPNHNITYPGEIMNHVIFEPLIKERSTTERSDSPTIVVEYATLDTRPTITVSIPYDSNPLLTETVRNSIGEIVLGRIDDIKGDVPSTPEARFANAAADAAARIQWLLRVHLPHQIVELRRANL
jgi:hypothetical protein